MLGLILPLATRLVGERFAKAASWAFIALLVLGALYAAYCWAWDRGRDYERAAWQTEVAEIRKERDDAMAALGAADAKDADALETSITENRKALDDETANLPDQPLSDRQRARACRELMRQGRRCPAPAAAP
ncbi:hypothetical protein [Sphingopyxis sp. 113P3]|uniref:hypothetical protein n=1 Tax=Sphingopyxis sp. (strain 113P3) TaxID=292913 RepID=UPI0006AD49B8|nr:hypothetical protein [Sphingopyxis sp. 113P3]ALC12458.1 hypothetical protein LH20_10900 [Sphingopyxis sp. 113P3]